MGIASAFEKFGEKLKNFEKADSSSKSILNTPTENQKIQQVINLQEQERKNKIKEEFEKYLSPVSAEVEEDEKKLVEALNLYKKISLVKTEFEKSKTNLKQYEINSPLAQKSEYTTGIKFVYLQAWFIKTYGTEKIIPVMEEKSYGNYILDFVPLDDYKMPPLLKEILFM